MINGVEIIDSHPRAVVIQFLLIYEAFAVLVDPNEGRLPCNHGNTCLNSWYLNA